VVHDLNTFPWPLPDSEFDFINCQDVTEHLDNINRVMEVIHRTRSRGQK